MQPTILRRIKQNWERTTLDKDKKMLWATFTMAFFGFLRSGELCTSSANGFDMAVTLSPQDIAVDNITNPQLLRITLKVSKTDPFWEGVDEVCLARTKDDLCPVSAVLAWLTIRGTSEGPLFLFESGSPLTRQALVSHLKRALVAAGINPQGYSGHSFRIVAATTAADKEIEDLQIKMLGRWKSNAYQRYIKPSGSRLATLSSSLT